MKEEKLPNIIAAHEIHFEKLVDCSHCHSHTTYHENAWALKVPIPEDKTRIYEVIWVPVKRKQD